MRSPQLWWFAGKSLHRAPLPFTALGNQDSDAGRIKPAAGPYSSETTVAIAKSPTVFRRSPGIISISTPDAAQHPAIAAYPLASDPVRVCRYPNADGPMEPATPNAPAAAVSLRISVGIAQNIGRYANSTIIRLNRHSVIASDGGNTISPSAPSAPSSTGTAACHRRSNCLSECHPLNSIATSATPNGIASNDPTCTSDNPVWRFSSVGIQKIAAYPGR